MNEQKIIKSTIGNNDGIKNQDRKIRQDKIGGNIYKNKNNNKNNNNNNNNNTNNNNKNNNNNKTQNKNKYQNNKPPQKNGIKCIENQRKVLQNEVAPPKPPNRGGFPSKPDGLIDRIEFYQTPTLNLEIAYFNPDVVRSGIFGPHNPHLKPGQVNTKAIQEYQRKFNKPPPPHVYTGNFHSVEPVQILPHPNLMFNTFNCHPLTRGQQIQNMCKPLPQPRYGGIPKYGGVEVLPVNVTHPMNRNTTFNQNNYSKNINRNRNSYKNNIYDGGKKQQQQQIPQYQHRKGGNYNNKIVSNNITISNQYNNIISNVENNENNEKKNQTTNSMVKNNDTTNEINNDSALKEQIKKQIEYYFSEDNLIKDLYIRQLMNDSEEKGFVMIEDILNFNKIKNLTKTFPNPHETLIEVLKDSKKLELSNDKLKIRPGTSVLDQLNNLSFL
uniref:HTH La-type RNA-binding domain-containing protein n=1 Tax=Strongyloides stercoralis TaxID=6248 RepID=A0AAF5I3Q3_STRER